MPAGPKAAVCVFWPLHDIDVAQRPSGDVSELCELDGELVKTSTSQQNVETMSCNGAGMFLAMWISWRTGENTHLTAIHEFNVGYGFDHLEEVGDVVKTPIW